MIAFMIPHMLAFNAPTKTPPHKPNPNIFQELKGVEDCTFHREREIKMRGWKDLEVVETIYEEDHEDYYSSSSTSSSLLLTPSTSLTTGLEGTVKAWSLATGFDPDVMIEVNEHCFHLHKDPLISRSGYLKRHLTDSSKIILNPPLNITVETFSTIADFCYCSFIVITPFNVAALRIAAELLDMTEENGDANGDENLQLKTETYFCQAISVNRDYAVIILRSCLALLPESEETALLASRCIEALGFLDGVNGVNGWIDDVKSLTVGEFQMIADSMHDLFTRSHDLLYKIVDVYLKLQEQSEKITEEEKIRICSSVDCNKLSSQLILHAVQNPRMPLRFIVRAMMVEQLTTRHSINFSTTTLSVIKTNDCYMKAPRNNNSVKNKDVTNINGAAITLGTILQRDAAIRQVAQLKESVETTSFKIETLEREVINMKKLLNDHPYHRCDEKKREIIINDHSGRRRSQSFRLSSSEINNNKVERGDSRGSTSLVSFRFSNYIGEDDHDLQRNGGSSSSSSSSVSSYSDQRSSFSEQKRRIITTSTDRSLGWRLINGLRSAFRLSSSSSTSKSKVLAAG